MTSRLGTTGKPLTIFTVWRVDVDVESHPGTVKALTGAKKALARAKKAHNGAIVAHPRANPQEHQCAEIRPSMQILLRRRHI